MGLRLGLRLGDGAGFEARAQAVDVALAGLGAWARVGTYGWG